LVATRSLPGFTKLIRDKIAHAEVYSRDAIDDREIIGRAIYHGEPLAEITGGTADAILERSVLDSVVLVVELLHVRRHIQPLLSGALCRPRFYRRAVMGRPLATGQRLSLAPSVQVILLKLSLSLIKLIKAIYANIKAFNFNLGIMPSPIVFRLYINKKFSAPIAIAFHAISFQARRSGPIDC